MLLGFRGVVREKDETLAHPQKLDALFKVMRLFCGIFTGLCLFEIKAPSSHHWIPLLRGSNAEKTESFPSLIRGG
jgi:hypothetical protein